MAQALRMLALRMICQIVFFQNTIGADHCSRNINEEVECLPCSEVCSERESLCNGTYSLCPKQCGETEPASNCRDVCSSDCLDGRCEYTNGLMNLRCNGCKPEFTGQMCQEYCPTNCYQCHQDNSTCITCKDNSRPPNCSGETETTSAHATTLGTQTTNVNINNCSTECMSCNVTSGYCIECTIGRYGDNCQYSCTHCQATSCNHMNCYTCIRMFMLSGMKCTGKWTEYITDGTSTVTAYYTTAKYILTPESEVTLVLISGTSAALLLALVVICIWRRVTTRYELKCMERVPGPNQTSKQDSSGSLATHHDYSYIDGNYVERSGLNRSRCGTPPCCVKV